MIQDMAIRLAESKWWEAVPLTEAARFQLFEERLCMPFGEFHKGVEQLLKRPVFTHEFAFADKVGGLRDEALGRAPARTLQEILDLIPAEKRIVVQG